MQQSNQNHVAILEDFLQKHSNQTKKVLIFDFDQTLCHLHLPWSQHSKLMQAYLQDLDADLYAKNKPRNPTSHVINVFIETYGDVVWTYDRATSEEFESTQLTAAPCNLELLMWIDSQVQAKNFVAYVWSSNISSTIHDILQTAGFGETFAGIYGKDKYLRTKPEPDGFRQIFFDAREEIADLEPANCVMIGNNLLDDRGAAQNAGIDFVHIEFEEKL